MGRGLLVPTCNMARSTGREGRGLFCKLGQGLLRNILPSYERNLMCLVFISPKIPNLAVIWACWLRTLCSVWDEEGNHLDRPDILTRMITPPPPR